MLFSGNIHLREKDVENFKPGDIIKLKKTHPCGNNNWQIKSTGLEIKLECTKCKRLLFLELYDFKKKFKKIEVKE